MKQRLKRFDRLIKVQQHMHRNAELHLANLHRKENELKNAQDELLETMGEESALHGLFVDVQSRRLKALALEERQTQNAIVQQKAVTLEKALQVKRTEKTHDRLKEQAHHEQERKDLIAILEAMAGRAGTSLP